MRGVRQVVLEVRRPDCKCRRSRGRSLTSARRAARRSTTSAPWAHPDAFLLTCGKAFLTSSNRNKQCGRTQCKAASSSRKPRYRAYSLPGNTPYNLLSRPGGWACAHVGFNKSLLLCLFERILRVGIRSSTQTREEIPPAQDYCASAACCFPLHLVILKFQLESNI